MNAEQIASAIDQTLEQRHPTDTPEWWRGLGPHAPEIIERKLQGETRVYTRVRLIEALGHFPSPAGLDGRMDVLKGIAMDASDDVIRNAAIRSVAAASEGREVEWIAQFLKHADGQTRRTAAEALTRIGTALAREKLAQYEKSTGHPALASPPLVGTLQKSGSSIHQPSPDWQGDWKGFWIEPGRVTPVRMSLDAQSIPQQWKARAVLGKKQNVIELETTHVRGAVATGSWMEAQGARPVSFEARVEQEGRYRVLRLRVAERAGTLVLFRTAS